MRPDRSRLRAPLLGLVPYVLIGGLVLGLYGQVLGLGFLGHDSLPLIETSRILSLHDALGTFTESFMDGHFAVDFYRPVLNLSFALDYALSGLEPLGYQVQHLVILFAACAALFALARRCLGPRSTAAALLGTALFLVYPGHWEVVAVVCRRQDALSGAFMTLAVGAALAARERGRLGIASGLFAALAVGAKETGFLAVPLVWTALFLFAPGAGGGAASRGDDERAPRSPLLGRVLDAFRGSVPALLGLLVLTGLRWAAIGGIGGHANGSLFDLDAALYFLRRTMLFDPGYHLSTDGNPPLLALFLAVVLVYVVALLGTRAARRGQAAEDGRSALAVHDRALRTFALGLVWILFSAIVMAYVGKDRIAAWHVFLPMLGAGLVFASAFAAAIDLARAGGPGHVWTRVAAVLALLPAAGILIWQLQYAAWLERPRQWAAASRMGQAYLARLESEIEAASPGDSLWVPGVPVRLPRKVHDPGIRRPSIFAGHSLAAWARMRFPDEKVLVVGPIGRRSSRADGVLVAIDVDVLDHGGPQGELREMLARLAAEKGLDDGRPDPLGLDEARLRAGYSAQKKSLLEAVLASEHERVERLLMLARYFDSIWDTASAWRAVQAAKAESPDDPRVLGWITRLQATG